MVYLMIDCIYHLVAVNVGELMINSSVVGSKVDVVSNPRKNELD